MADRIYKGKIVLTPKIDKQNQLHFPEAAARFDQKHAGGLVAFETLREILEGLCHGLAGFDVDEAGLRITGKEAWCEITQDGTIEIGTSGV
jgi:hypothetical protein